MREKICFGGTFNPIHHGHLLCARAAAEAVGAKTVVIFPAGNPAHRAGQTDLAPPADRLEMCRLAVDGIDGFEVDDRECRRAGATYTIDTARELKKEGWSEVVWLIGADMLNTLPNWHEADALLREVRFIVMARPGTAFEWEKLPPEVRCWRKTWFGFRRSISAGRRFVAGWGWDCRLSFSARQRFVDISRSIGYIGWGDRGCGMINHYDIAYGLGVGISSPFWLAHPATRKKVLRAFSQRMGRVPSRDLSRPGIMVHAVSLGEINATRSLVEMIRAQRPGIDFIVSVTTETGFARGFELYGSSPDVTLVRYPLDFTSAVDRLLVTLRPAVVALLELEVWPNFIRRCASGRFRYC